MWRKAMFDQKDAVVTLLLTVLQEPDANKSRRQYLKAFGFDEINDQAIYDLVEDRVFDAISLKEPVVEIEPELAQTMLLLLKNGLKKSRGGQRNTRHHEMRKLTLVSLGRQIKAELIASGMNATQAHLQAAEEAAKEGKRRRLDFTAGYLQREMQNTDQTRRRRIAIRPR
jgi:hypothetical protein